MKPEQDLILDVGGIYEVFFDGKICKTCSIVVGETEEDYLMKDTGYYGTTWSIGKNTQENFNCSCVETTFEKIGTVVKTTDKE